MLDQFDNLLYAFPTPDELTFCAIFCPNFVFDTTFPPVDAAFPAVLLTLFPISLTKCIAANVSPKLWDWSNPKIFFTIFSAVHINDIQITDKNIFANDGDVLNMLNALETKTKYIIMWKGWINTANINSFIQVFKACAWPSFILSIEYVIVINGDIIIKNPTVNIRFVYANKNAHVIPIRAKYTIKAAQDFVAPPETMSHANCVTTPFPITTLFACPSIFTNAVLASNVNKIMYPKKNNNAKLITQSISIRLYFAWSDATVDIAILIPT